MIDQSQICYPQFPVDPKPRKFTVAGITVIENKSMPPGLAVLQSGEERMALRIILPKAKS